MDAAYTRGRESVPAGSPDDLGAGFAVTRRRIWFPIYTASPQGHHSPKGRDCLLHFVRHSPFGANQ